MQGETREGGRGPQDLGSTMVRSEGGSLSQSEATGTAVEVPFLLRILNKNNV